MDIKSHKNNSTDTFKSVINDINGMPLYYFAHTLSSYFSAKILEKIENHPVYKDICSLSLLNNYKTRLYFQMYIRMEIEPYILQLAKMLKLGNPQLSKSGVWIPSDGIFLVLREVWPTEEVPLMNSFIKELITSFKKTMKSLMEKKIIWLFNSYNKYWCCSDFSKLTLNKPVIAVHYAEGIDIVRRSDTVWFPNSNIEPYRVLMYLDTAGHGVKKKYKFLLTVPKEVNDKLKSFGFNWILIPQMGIPYKRENVWMPPGDYGYEKFTILKEQINDKIGTWIINIANKLVKEVYVWKSFFERFNVKMVFVSEENDPINIAQGIAFDNMGVSAGVTIGKQRSDIGELPASMTGFYSKDISFTWNNRFQKYLSLPYNKNNTQIITGHPNDRNFYSVNDEIRNTKNNIVKSGAKFIVALFDTGHGDPLYRKFSTSDMESFYMAFLNWVLDDKEIGIVIKSKKPYILKKLSALLPLLSEVEATGRCARLEDEFGHLPSDASKIADFAVGAGVSSALTEAIIAGCKGVHYWKNYPVENEYYQWGFERFVFNNLERLMKTLKDYKNNPKSNPNLGNWSEYMEQLDPFRDGRGGERIGTYMKWLLEAFDNGKNRDEAIQDANRLYAKQWGKDKVIDMNKYEGS